MSEEKEPVKTDLEELDSLESWAEKVAKKKLKEEKKMTWSVYALIALVIGGGSFFGGMKVEARKNKNDTVDKPAVVQPEVVTGSKEGEEFVDIEFLTMICSDDYVEDEVVTEHSDGSKTTSKDLNYQKFLFCQKYACWSAQRGVDAKVSPADCSSLNNASLNDFYLERIDSQCSEIPLNETDDYKKCQDRTLDVVTKAKSGQ